MIKETIFIEIHDGNTFTVRKGERWADHLCWDEMLGTVAELTHPQIGGARYRMDTARVHTLRQEAHEARMAELEERNKESVA